MNNEKILEKIYYDSSNPAAFGSANKLYDAAKLIDPQISTNDVEEWLKGQFTYTLHKNALKNFGKNKIMVTSVDEQWQADLVEMQKYSKKKQGFSIFVNYN